MADTFAAQLRMITKNALEAVYTKQVNEAFQEVQHQAWEAAHRGGNHTTITIKPPLAIEAHCLLGSRIRQEGFCKHSIVNIDLPNATYVEVWW